MKFAVTNNGPALIQVYSRDRIAVVEPGRTSIFDRIQKIINIGTKRVSYTVDTAEDPQP
jgi:hypothetical protein